MFLAGVAHPVERHLAKVEVASSSLVTRSIKEADANASASLFYFAVTGSKIKSDSPVDCRASPVLTAMLPYEVSIGHRGFEPRHPPEERTAVKI